MMHITKRTILLSLLCLCLSTQAVGVQSTQYSKWQNFDAKTLASYEVEMWRAYYEADYLALWQWLMKLFSEQLDIGTYEASWLSYYAAYAAMKFSRLPDEANSEQISDAILPSLEKFYRHLKSVTQAPWSAEKAARAELAWWQMRRLSGKDKVSQVGEQITQLYSVLYGQENQCLEKAGYIRAQVARLRDRQKREGNMDWEQLKHRLYHGYQWLKRGINGCGEGDDSRPPAASPRDSDLSQ